MSKIYDYTESELVQMYQNEEISLLEFVNLHSDGWKEDFEDFCERENLEINEQSAEDFLDWKDKLLEDALESGNA